MYAFIGCYTTADRKGHGTGISTYHMDSASGVWEHLNPRGITNPSFLAIDPRQQFLYSSTAAAARASARFDRSKEWRPHVLEHAAIGGTNPVQLSIHPSGSCLVVATNGGQRRDVANRQHGTLSPPSSVLELTGAPGPIPVEQSGPHPHDIPLDPAGQFAVVPDKGLDRVFVFRLDTTSGKLRPTEQGSVQSKAGAGPRHAAFHPTRRMCTSSTSLTLQSRRIIPCS